MGAETAIDEVLLSRLPLPLAQLYRRAHNDKTPKARHDNAGYLWEASLKLLAATAVVEYAALDDPDPTAFETLTKLARPSLGHWWEFTKLLVPVLAQRRLAGYDRLHQFLFRASLPDMPCASSLSAALHAADDGRDRPPSPVRLLNLIDQVVKYRNDELGHGANSNRTPDFHERLGQALRAGAAEVLGRLDVLAGRTLIYVAEVKRLPNADWQVWWHELTGESPLDRRSVVVPGSAPGRLPAPERVYLQAPAADGPPRWRPLNPLWVYKHDQNRIFVLNGRKGGRCKYLCYWDGGRDGPEDLAVEQLQFLAHVLGMPEVAPEQADAWAATAEAEDPSARGADTGRDSVGEFDLRGKLGHGATGTVYRAWQRSMSREVALKVLDGIGPRVKARFQREVQALARVDHPHLVKVYTSGSDRDRLYYTMEMVEGDSLAAIYRRLRERYHNLAGVRDNPWWDAVGAVAAVPAGPDPPGDGSTPCAPAPAARPPGDYVRALVTWVRQVAQAAHALHEKDIVHRDIKPDNILVAADGARAVLVDLGVAKRLADDGAGDKTLTDKFAGTPRYASPQQMLAPTLPDRRNDVYSLGVTLWELLTLQPFLGITEDFSAAKAMLRVNSKDPERVRQFSPSVTTDLQAVVEKCLDRDPDQRYPTAGDLAADLQRFLDGVPVQARPVGTLGRGLKWVRRNPAGAALIAALVALPVIVVLAFVLAERRARATNYVDALTTQDMAKVPLLIRGLNNQQGLRWWANPMLKERYEKAAPHSRERLRYALALLPVDPKYVNDLLDAVPTARAEEVAVLREALKDPALPDQALQNQAERVRALWPRLDGAPPAERLRLAALLAGFLPPDERWQQHAPVLVEHLVGLNLLEVAAWVPALVPLYGPLTPELVKKYGQIQNTLKAGDFDIKTLVDSAVRLDVAAALLVRMVADQPDELAKMLQTADARHYDSFLTPALTCQETIAPKLREVLHLQPTDRSPEAEAEVEALAARQAHAAVTLFRFGEREPAWDRLQFDPAKNPDPTVRSYLIHGLAARGANAAALILCYQQETDVSARTALLLALGEYDPATLRGDEREELTKQLLDEYRNNPDAGLHGAIDWLLRRKWGRAADLDQINRSLCGQPAGARNWFVNGRQQTFTVIRKPQKFLMGSPVGEPGRADGPSEAQRLEKVGRPFAIAVREVTVEGFLLYDKTHQYSKEYAPERDGPINITSWYDAAAYCNWLSEQENICVDQWCYEPNAEGLYAPGMRTRPNHLDLKGYRLPTEAEWEYACRAGATTTRPYGRGTGLLGHYAWFLWNGQDRLSPCGQLKPNDLGLFDMLGNAIEWCQDEDTRGRDPPKDIPGLGVIDAQIRVLRGGQFAVNPTHARSAYRANTYHPNLTYFTIGFRPVRTYP